MKYTLCTLLLATLSLSKAFTLFAKPVFWRGNKPYRIIGAAKIQNLCEHGVFIRCQSKNIELDKNSSLESVTTDHEISDDDAPITEEPHPVESFKEREATLTNELYEWEDKLRSERIKLNDLESKLSESGKNGYYLVQAQLQDFRRKVEADQKRKISNDRREYILKLLPVIDAFREAPQVSPAVTPRGESMHESYQILLANMMELFEKYGYKEFSAACGDCLDPKLHQVATVLQPAADAAPVAEGTILLTTRPGVLDESNKILRKALVAVAGAPMPTAETLASPVSEVNNGNEGNFASKSFGENN